MSNSHLQMSGEARTRLRRHERPVYRYYDDGGKPGIGNCTWGIGTLAHRGPCSREELSRKVLPDAVEASFAARLADVEQTIRRRVPDQELTQEQFDALVSFTYNVGQRGAERVLYLVNNGDFKEAARSISKTIYR